MGTVPSGRATVTTFTSRTSVTTPPIVTFAWRTTGCTPNVAFDGTLHDALGVFPAGSVRFAATTHVSGASARPGSGSYTVTHAAPSVAPATPAIDVRSALSVTLVPTLALGLEGATVALRAAYIVAFPVAPSVHES